MNKKIISLILKVIITFLMMMNLLDVKNYNSFSLFLLIFIFLFFYNFDFKEKKVIDVRNNRIYIIFSFLIAFSQVLGFVVYKYQFSRDVSALREFLKFTNFVNIFGLFFLIYTLLKYFVPKLLDLNVFSRNNQISSKKVFFSCALIIFVSWIPYFLALFPAILTSDSVDQFSHVVNGFKIVSDHHPVAHTLFVGIIYRFGFWLFHKPMLATACVSLVQMLIMSCIFSYLILFLHKKNVSRKILIFILLYFSLSPIHGYYSVTMWKDILFGGFFLLFTLKLIELDESKSFKIINMFSFILISLLVLFFRNNALYVYLFSIPFLLFIYKDKFVKVVLCFVISLSCYFVVKGPIFAHFKINKSASSEYIAIPLQQIGRMTYKFVEFTDNERSMINDLLPIETMSDAYHPMTVDSIKFHREYHREVFDSNKSKYFKLWLQLVVKHPSIAVESYLNSTLGYWYSGVEFWATSNTIFPNDMGIYLSPKGGKILNGYVNKIESRDIPLISLQWSIGLCLIFIGFSVMLLLVQRKYRSLFYYVPFFALWLTLMVATPVFAEFRYVYSAFTCLPLFLVLPFLNNEAKTNRKAVLSKKKNNK